MEAWEGALMVALMVVRMGAVRMAVAPMEVLEAHMEEDMVSDFSRCMFDF